ncbi:hypothetical protein U27_04748 [Candidatus Vecturithrix granuli]|uniref:Exo-alpha-sialidase n=1 Tax=Vecturithrix granuli TaxID=1499967 RepID=A0A081BZM6_VECG1|nr:hypothetical protein U27_04748 [Candidatus Vecturithrix granuli]
MMKTKTNSVKIVGYLVLTLIVMVGGIVISYAADAQDPSNSPAPMKDDEQTQVLAAEDMPHASGLRWAGDKLIASSSDNEMCPSLASAPDGTLYAAIQDTTDGYIKIYRSINGGESWSLWFGVRTGVSSHNPSLTYIEDTLNNEKWLYVVYEGTWADDSRNVMLYRKLVAGAGTSGPVTIASGISMPADQHIAPEICADYPAFISGGIYLYVTYAVQAVDYYPVMFSRSLDRGASWSAPVNVTGGIGSNSGWQTQPDIAFGTTSYLLFIAFEKLGWTGSAWANQIWVRKSTDFGANWGDPVQLTTSTDAEYHARVSAAIGNNSVLIAYTRDWNNSGDWDIWYAYSTDAGSSWNTSYQLATLSSVNEDAVELDRSWSGGSFHAAYWQENDIMYRAAPTTAPSSWSAATRINAVSWVSHEKPAVTINSTKPAAQEAGIAWTVLGGASYDVYFDAGYFLESYLLWTK